MMPVVGMQIRLINTTPCIFINGRMSTFDSFANRSSEGSVWRVTEVNTYQEQVVVRLNGGAAWWFWERFLPLQYEEPL